MDSTLKINVFKLNIVCLIRAFDAKRMPNRHLDVISCVVSPTFELSAKLHGT